MSRQTGIAKGFLSAVLAALICLLPLRGSASAGEGYELGKGLDLLTKQLLADRVAIGDKRVAVTDFTALSGEAGTLGAFLAEELQTRLAGSSVKLLEKRLLVDAMKELKLNMTDMVDPEQAKRFGRFTGTDLILAGRVTIFVDTVRINARLIDIESRVVVGTGSVELNKDRELLKVMGIAYPGSILVDSTSSSEVYINGELAGLTDWRGRLNVTKVRPGSYNIRIRQEGYKPVTRYVAVPEDREVRVDAELEKLPSPLVAAGLSLLFPGAGDLYLGHSDWWVYPVAVGASIYGAYVYSKKTDEIIWKEGDKYSSGRWEERGNGPVYLFASFAAIVWGYDILHVSHSATEIRNKEYESGLSLELTPRADGAMLVKQWAW